MAYDPFDPTNQNVIEPYARAGTRALGDAATSLRNSATNTAQNFQRNFNLNAPNYSLIAPATGPARNRPNVNVPALPANVGRGRAIAAGGNDPAGALSDLTAPVADLAARQRNRLANEPYQGLTNFALSPSVTPATQRFGGGTNPYEGSAVADALNALKGVLPERRSSVTTRQRGSARNAPAEIPRRPITTNRRGQQQGGGVDIDAFIGNALTSGNAPASRERRGQRGDNDVFGGIRDFFGGLSFGTGENPALAGTLRGQGGGRTSGSATTEAETATPTTATPTTARTSTPTDSLAVGEGEGIIRGLDSGRTVRGSNADARRLNTFDLKGANEAFARANEIRRQTIADLAGPTFDASQVTIAGGQDAGGDLRSERLRLAKALEDGTGNFQQNFRALQALDAIARTDVSQAGLAPDAAQLASLGLRQDQFGLQQDQFALDQAKFLNAPADFKQQEFSATLADYREADENGLFDGPEGEALKLRYQTQLRNLANGVGFLEATYEGLFPPEFANGGLVGAIETYANGGMISPSGPPPMPAIMQQYQQYADGAREMGLTAVPFEQFASLQSSSKDTIQSFADGGMVGENDVSGKMIVDTDPDAPTDSIPAMIDGQRPAALDSGEFVIPKDVVLYYGTDKLQKMIDKVRNPQGGQGNGGTQTALGI